MGWYVFGGVGGVTPPVPPEPVVPTTISIFGGKAANTMQVSAAAAAGASANEPLVTANAIENFPKIGDNVIRVGEVLFLNWNNIDITNINVIFYKGDQKIPITNKEVIDGQNSFNIFIDNSYFTEEFRVCKVRLEMKENPSVFIESPTFKVLRTDDRKV